MQRRRLGELEVSAVGLGCMGMTPIYGTPDDAESTATIHRALDLGVDFIDTSDMYGAGRNEELVGKALKGRRDGVVLATKFGNIRNPDGSSDVCGRPDYVVAACEASLKRLGVETIDLYYVHRIDPGVPIEDTVGAMSRLVEEGKIRHIGLSEAGPATLKRAHAAHKVTALQSEYSLWTRDVEAEILPLCEELGIGFVAYSPLGRGFLTAQVDPGRLEEKDRRRDMPRFQGENLEHNRRLVERLDELARGEGCAPAQLALAWLLSRKPFVVPLPGTKRRKWLEENVAAVGLSPRPDTLQSLDEIFAPGAAKGTRYPAGGMKRVGL